MIGKPLEGERLEAYAADVSQVAAAVHGLVSSDGWSIFLALFARRREEILEREDYDSLSDFRAARGAIKIVEGLFAEMSGYVADAEEATTALKELADRDRRPKERGIMLLDAVDGAGDGVSMEG